MIDKDKYDYLRRIAMLLGGITVFKYFGKKAAGRIIKKWTRILMTDEYNENLLELVSAASRVTPQKILELNLRSETGEPVERPLGSPKKVPSLDGLMFSFAQIETLPVPQHEDIDTTVIIGKKAQKPLVLETPIMVGGMAYGFAVSERVRVAIAKGCSMAGTAANTGQGGLLPKERQAAKQLILQYNRGHWSKDPETLRQADAIELHFGQGAFGGSFEILPAKNISREMRNMYGVRKGERILYPSRIPGINKPRDLVNKVRELRGITGGGIPIGAKIAGSDSLEKDLFWCLEAGLDFVTVSGSEGGSKGSPPTLQDDHGLPAIFGLCRAVNYLERSGARKEIDLITDGKLITPGDFLKALALGANAVYIGTAALYAVAHTQVLKAFPFEPPTSVAWNVSQLSHRFNVKKGADSLYNYLKSCTAEIRMSLSAMGKTAVHDLGKDDLIAIDPFIADITGVRLAHMPKS
ncbi:MAG: Glutamate synthase [NADPH] large chain [Candidatus Dichloromethanomonas elyunquensis]|nr:MAG: Glutamate synthase [NADPH] large chain [Candidatus Dichloromethanomonas elyunquensis]